MSNLKHLSVPELKKAHASCQVYIARLESKLAGQKERLRWIERYLQQKTPLHLTLRQIEARLGHPVIIKPDDEDFDL